MAGIAWGTGSGDAARTPADRPTSLPAGEGVPPALRSRLELAGRGVRFPPNATPATALPITANGTTYQMAQTLAWLDDDHFAVGRWDGSMTVFGFTESGTAGPLITEAVNSPAFQGVRMLSPLGERSIVTSNDNSSFALWTSPSGSWKDLRLVGTYAYDEALTVVTGGIAVAGHLVLGHSTGHLSVWRASERHAPRLLRTIDVRNPAPVNPWDLHDIYSVEVLAGSRDSALVVTGSEDGYVCVLEVPSGRVLSRTVFNPSAQRGINHVSVRGDAVLVANCSVGPSDHNLWYYSVDRSNGQVTLRDKVNLIVDTRRPQAFNFSTIWGSYAQGPCWFASTEEGALWMGTAGAKLEVIGYQEVTSPLGSALGWRDDPGRLAMVAHDLYEFVTT
ncbi:WD40 repeat domain-containing protein [Nonomuraea sp. K274]|uniref:WD40 repeat domain-containing protein n=1 Tax=Nonomuraea cypriaca TaxID=1187855 RepID=A0A931AAL3_9ACTN|nr:WD40 repeat domain-containing protein [Nonomuraea cypriaca]MBF8188323.1 WD40 repeat domain-containing protein [Nonomuraea cypriaca]